MFLLEHNDDLRLRFNPSLSKHEIKRIKYFLDNNESANFITVVPLRPRPFPDETLSSWLMRLAAANGLSINDFSKLALNMSNSSMFGVLDCIEKPNVLDLLAKVSCIPTEFLRVHTFYDTIWEIPGVVAVEKGLVYGEFSFGSKLSHPRGVRRNGAFRACLECWKEDNSPYIRMAWRQSFTTVCPKHKIVLSAGCKKCGIRFNSSFAGAFSNTKFAWANFAVCGSCGFDLREQSLDSFDDWTFSSIRDRECYREWAEKADPADHVEVQERYTSCIFRGFFSIDDACWFEENHPPLAAAWDYRANSDLYPYVQTASRPNWDFYERQVDKWVQAELARFLLIAA